MVCKATFNNIAAISWQSVLLVEDTGVNTTDRSQVTDKRYHIMLYSSPWARVEPITSVVIGTDCIGSSKSNYHTITATTTPKHLFMNDIAKFNIVLVSQYYNVSICTSIKSTYTYMYNESWTFQRNYLQYELFLRLLSLKIRKQVLAHILIIFSFENKKIYSSLKEI
jgi:hypothetical protein